MSVIAFRRWSVPFTGQLQALSWWVPDWQPGAVTTSTCQCARFSADRPDHTHPVSDSSCGLYGYKQPFPVCACPRWGRDHGAAGVIEGFGRTVEHDHGWRFEKARVLAVCDLTDHPAWVRQQPYQAEPAPWLSPAYARAGVAFYPDLNTMWSEWAPDLPVEPDRGRRGQFWCDWKPPRPRRTTTHAQTATQKA